jgi:hypothetical protein
MLILTPLVAPLVAGCGGYGSSASPSVDAAACNGVGGESTTEDQHAHSICVPTADLSSPPANGATYTSSNDSNHTHTLVLTSAQLTSIQSGQPVTVTSASAIDPINNDPHTHSWTLRRA